MSVNLYRSDGTTPLDGLAITNEQAGADSDVLTIKVKNDGATVAYNVLLVQRTADPVDPNTLLATGVPPQDEMWGRARVPGVTDWMPLGAYAGLLIGDMDAAEVVTVEYKSHPPSNAETGPYTRSPVPIYNEYSLPIPPSLTRVDAGILTGIGDYSHSGIVSGCAVTASGTPDAIVHCAAGLWVHRGVLYGKIPTDHTLNQNDSAAAALASGQSYKARISLGAGVTTATKGVKGTSPTAPDLPTGDLLAPDGEVTVDYQAGGTSVIETADLGGAGGWDRYFAEDGGGLNLTLHSGQAQGGSTWRFAQGTQTVVLDDAATNYVWQLASGLFDSTTTTAAPEQTAIGPLFKVVTAAGAISSITDWRTYAGRTVAIHMRGDMPGGLGEVDSRVVEHERLFIERITYRLSDHGGGASGQTKLDAELDGVTLYTDFATSDQRPVFAFDAADLIDGGGVHQVTELRRGQVLSLHVAEFPVGGTPVWAEVTFYCRVP